jgi:hypothetical protein
MTRRDATNISARPYSSSLSNCDIADGGCGIDATPLISNEERDASSAVAVASTDFQNNASIPDDRHDDAAQHAPSWRHPVLSTNAFLSRLSSEFSWQFLAWLGIDHLTMNGGTMPLLWSVSLPLFKELGIDASRQQLYTTMMTSPFALKPFIGAASDLFPIWGYNKRYLALFSIIIGCLGSSAILVIFHSGSASTAISNGPSAVESLADMIVISFFAMSLEVANLDVLAEGTYSGLMRRHPDSGSSIISFRTAIGCVGAIATKCYVGPLSDAGNFHAIFWIAFVLSIAPFLPTLRGWLPEMQRSADEDGMVRLCPGVMFHRGLFLKKRMPFIAISASGLAAPIVSAVTTYSDLGVGLVCSGFVLLTLAGLTYAVFPRSFFRITLGLMLGTLSQIRTNSALSYFYTADRECLPNGE